VLKRGVSKRNRGPGRDGGGSKVGAQISSDHIVSGGGRFRSQADVCGWRWNFSRQDLEEWVRDAQAMTRCNQRGHGFLCHALAAAHRVGRARTSAENVFHIERDAPFEGAFDFGIAIMSFPPLRRYSGPGYMAWLAPEQTNPRADIALRQTSGPWPLRLLHADGKIVLALTARTKIRIRSRFLRESLAAASVRASGLDCGSFYPPVRRVVR